MLAKPDRHNWNELNTYLRIHESYLAQAVESGFVLSHDLDAFEPDVLQGELILAGRIECKNGLFLDVDKHLEILDRQGRLYVRTREYSYQAMIVGSKTRPVFRYDNAHIHPSHADDHHKHCVNYQDWTYITPPQWIGHDNWPVLSEVIDELHQWWMSTGWQLTP